MKTLGIIGTAGRGPDGENMNSETWSRMLHVARLTIGSTESPVLISGGAAWSDHIAVRLFLENSNRLDLNLFLPVKFSDKFDESEITIPFNCGSTLNYYHSKFSRIIGQNTLTEIEKCLSMEGVTCLSGKGFHGRNTQIAKASDNILAFTFGNGKELKDGGTKDTWDKFMKKRIGIGYHYNLNENKMYKIEP